MSASSSHGATDVWEYNSTPNETQGRRERTTQTRLELCHLQERVKAKNFGSSFCSRARDAAGKGDQIGLRGLTFVMAR